MQSIANLLSFLLKDSYRGTIQLMSVMPLGASMAMRRIRYPFLKNLTAKMQLVYRRSRGGNVQSPQRKMLKVSKIAEEAGQE